jgi:drug/metabolite transporter (DMT)-like permease
MGVSAMASKYSDAALGLILTAGTFWGIYSALSPRSFLSFMATQIGIVAVGIGAVIFMKKP